MGFVVDISFAIALLASGFATRHDLVRYLDGQQFCDAHNRVREMIDALKFVVIPTVIYLAHLASTQ